MPLLTDEGPERLVEPTSHARDIANLTRRGFIGRILVSGAAASVSASFLAGCGEDPGPRTWAPSVLAPVFYGFEDVTFGDAPLRLFYPSRDGAPQDAPIVQGVGRYPLVMFLHGHCNEKLHFRRWLLMASQLARSGYVVAVPDLPGIRAGRPPFLANHPDVERVRQILKWLREGWMHRSLLMSRTATAIVGHSYGALLGGRIIDETPGVASVYVCLSGVWDEWESRRPLTRLNVPSLFMLGEPTEDLFTQPRSPVIWNRIAAPKHRVQFAGAHHFDYLAQYHPSCGGELGRCRLTGRLAADLSAIYISKYLPPEEAGILPGFIPDTLVLPRVTPTERQRAFGGGFLTGLGAISRSPECRLTIEWVTPDGAGSTRLPT